MADVHARRRLIGSRRIANFCDLYRRAFFHHERFGIEPTGEVELLCTLSQFAFKTILDVGANQGHWSNSVLGYFPNATLHCFEIVPKLQAELMERFGVRPEVRVHKFGLSDSSGNKKVVIYDESSYLSSAETQSVYAGLKHSFVNARFLTGAEFGASNDLAPMSLMKTDCEGHDLAILRGFGASLTKLDLIQFEFLTPLRFRLPYIQEYLEVLKGFRVGRLLPIGVDFDESFSAHDSIYSCNYIAVRDDRKDIIRAVQRFRV
jgi:FkbM family methyltransferase